MGLLALSVVAGCHGPGIFTDVRDRYLREREFRRDTLVSSLVNSENLYSRLRLDHYATGDSRDWDRLPVWNPPVRPVTADDLDAGTPAAGMPWSRLAVGDDTGLPSEADLVALGEAAFFTYPVELMPPVRLDAAATSRYGLWVDARRGVGGLVYIQSGAGPPRIELTCASCHADLVGRRLIAGVPNGRIDIGRMAADAGAAAGVPTAALVGPLTWGPGRVDVTTTDGSVPERMADLRPIRWASHLQYDATLRQLSVASLAIRIETLIITTKNEALRPPRIVSLALAAYLHSLSVTLPALPTQDSPGAALFAERCSGCHAGPDLGGGPLPLDGVGTDPALGESLDRGTGAYRIPALRGVGNRSSLLHDGTVPDFASLLDPGRIARNYAGGLRRPGPIPGHLFGLGLSVADRVKLVSYLQML